MSWHFFMRTKESPSHPSLHDTQIHTTGQKDSMAQGVFWWNPLGTQLTTQGHTQHSGQQPVVHTRGHQGSYMHFLYSQDLIHSQRMPVPRTGSWTLQNFNYFYSGLRETRNYNKSGGIIPEQPSAIVKDARGKLLCWECHNEQELYLLAKSTTVWVITPISFTQCQRTLPFEILTSSQIRTRSNIHAMCHGQGALPSPQPTFQEATVLTSASPLPISNFLATGKEKW